MSFHAGQTFTFGEQPSATKWQYIWDNDYALADGTGISDDAIIARHLTDHIITSSHVDWAAATGKVWWEELGRSTAASTVTSLSVASIAAKKYLKTLYFGIPNGNTSEFMRFNNDSGNNYQRNTSDDGGGVTNANSQPGMQYGASALFRYGRMEIFNSTAQEKGFFGQTVYIGTAGAANPVTRTEVAGKWANTAAQISRVDIVAVSGGFLAGSELVVLGHN